MTADEADSLVGRIARVLDEVRDDLCGFDAEEMSAAVLPIVEAEVRKAKAEAWQEGANFALPGKETYWISKHNPHRATETGGQR